MKSILRLSIFILLLSSSSLYAKANDCDLFSYDRNQIQQAVSELSNLETYIEQNASVISVDRLKQEGASMVKGFLLNSCPFNMSGGEPPLGIPSFLWGCCLGVSGLIVVYIVTDNDREEVKKALNGCLVSGVVVIALYAIAILSAASTPQTM